jgi:hypothetical protein
MEALQVVLITYFHSLKELCHIVKVIVYLDAAKMFELVTVDGCHGNEVWSRLFINTLKT